MSHELKSALTMPNMAPHYIITIGVNHVASFLSCCKCNEKVDPSPEHAFIECAKCHLKQKQTASKAHWFVQVLFHNIT